MEEIFAAWLPLIYAGVLSCGVAYTLQIIAQKDTDPAVASLLLSLESVFAALTGWAILGEETFCARDVWLRIGICGNYSCTASGRKYGKE